MAQCFTNTISGTFLVYIPGAVNETDSLFVDYLPANHTILGPLDLNPDSIASIGAARSNCGAGNDQQCIFDYM